MQKVKRIIESDFVRVEFDPTDRHKRDVFGFVNIWRDDRGKYLCNISGEGSCYQVVPGELYRHRFEFITTFWRMVIEEDKHFVEVLKPIEMKKYHS